MTWIFITRAVALKNGGSTNEIKYAAATAEAELRRLAKQKCPYCSGYGHSGNDCPTDRKLEWLRHGTSLQRTLMKEARQFGRIAAGMGNVSGYSTLSPIPPGRGLAARRARAMAGGYESDNLHPKKRGFAV